jgi:hypothetical protein
MAKSAVPWTRHPVVLGATDSVSRVDPPMSPKFHPTPEGEEAGNSSSSPVAGQGGEHGGGPRIQRADQDRALAAPSGRRSGPTRGLKANMPAMCSEIT